MVKNSIITPYPKIDQKIDEFDEETLDALRDGKPHSFNQIIEKINFSHNTLGLHLDNLVDQGLITREKVTRETRGRPSYVYSLSSVGGRAFLMLRSGVEGVVVVPFVSLGQVCRFEMGGFCKGLRVGCEAQICPQIGKWV
jgi:DNA-binding Lrp family transcriptional regulator